MKLSKLSAAAGIYAIGSFLLAIGLDVTDLTSKDVAVGTMLILWAIGAFVVAGIFLMTDIEDDDTEK